MVPRARLTFLKPTTLNVASTAKPALLNSITRVTDSEAELSNSSSQDIHQFFKQDQSHTVLEKTGSKKMNQRTLLRHKPQLTQRETPVTTIEGQPCIQNLATDVHTTQP